MKNSELSHKSKDILGTEKIEKLVLSFFATSLIGMILNTIYNLTDTLFISWGVGDMAMGGVTIIAPFVLLQTALSTMIGGGASFLVARKMGENKPLDAGNITANAMTIFYIISSIMTIISFIFIDELLSLFGAENEILPYAKKYFTIILMGNLFSTGFSAIMRAEGNNLYGMLVWVLPITINIILDAVFILILKWGIVGAGLATVICQFSSFALAMLFFAKFSKQQFKGAKINRKTLFEIFKIGFPSLVQLSSLALITLMLNKIATKFSGSIGVVTVGYVMKIITYTLSPLIAISFAISPIVSYNYGKGSHERVANCVSFCTKFSLIYIIFILIIIQIIPKYLIMMFTQNTDIISMGTVALRICSLSLIFSFLPIIIGTKMQAIGRKLLAIIIFASNAVFIVLPSILLGNRYGIMGIAWAYVIANCCSTVLVCVILWIEKRNNLAKINSVA